MCKYYDQIENLKSKIRRMNSYEEPDYEKIDRIYDEVDRLEEKMQEDNDRRILESI